MIFIQINININRNTLTREATKNEVESVYSKIYIPLDASKTANSLFFLKRTVTLLKIIGA